MGSLAGKTALVTGAGRGIGRAIACRLASDGARVGVHYGQSADSAERVVAQIQAEGGEAFAIQAMLGAPGDAEALWEAYDAHADGVDIVVNNAGILGRQEPFGEVTQARYDELFAVNTRAPFFILQHGLTRLRDGGRIVNLSTSLTHGAYMAELAAYSMSKAAIDVLTAALAKDLGARGVTVNAVGPGLIDTDMNASWLRSPEGRAAASSRSPLGRVATAEDVADVVGFLVSDDARWVTGQWIDASGGSLL